MKRGDCGCRNHLGARKVKYPSKEIALEAILNRHMQHGTPHEAYACPNMKNVWHVKSIRTK